MTEDKCKLSEYGLAGGLAALKKYGREHYVRMGKLSALKRAQNRKEKVKPKAKISRGHATLAKYGVQHYVEIGRKGGKARAARVCRLPSSRRAAKNAPRIQRKALEVTRSEDI